MDTYINLVKTAVETYIKTGKIITPVKTRGVEFITPPDNLPKEIFTRRAGVFVSIHKRKPPPPQPITRPTTHPLSTPQLFDGLEVGGLRGCIGTYLPTQENIAQEIIKNAIDSATQDPRFPPVTREELPSLVYSVDILSEPKLVADISCLNPKTYGLIVSAREGRRGLLLPDLEGVDTVEQQISICRQKAGISEDEPITLFRFTVERHGQK